MRYYGFDDGGEPRLLVRDGDRVYDLTSVRTELRSVTQLLSAAGLTGTTLDDVAERLIERAETRSVGQLDERTLLPVVPDEVWAAGVTYEISEHAREDESRLPEVYRDVYHSDRPEIFFKATANRTVGHGQPIGVREDSTWDVPEPELAVVLFEGEIAGYTVGNDVSSREIEGDNPLYLPQAKVYDRCCSIGPCITSAASIDDPHDLDIAMSIERDGEILFEGTASTSEMVRSCEELVSYYRRSNVLPRVAVLLTGTSLVPAEDVTLLEGDVVEIDVESIGTLRNPVVTV